LFHGLNHRGEAFVFRLKCDVNRKCRRRDRPGCVFPIVALGRAGGAPLRTRTTPITRFGRPWRSGATIPIPVWLAVALRTATVALGAAVFPGVFGVRPAGGLDPFGGKLQFLKRQRLVLRWRGVGG
jgi:hypothetical protein